MGMLVSEVHYSTCSVQNELVALEKAVEVVHVKRTESKDQDEGNKK